MPRRWMLVMIALAIITASLWYFSSRKAIDVNAESPVLLNPGSPPSSSEISTSEPIRGSSTVLQPATPESTPLASYQRPGSIRAFVLKALNEPSQGSVYYASQAVAECSALKDTGVLANPQPSGRRPFTGEALDLSNEAQVKQIEVSRYWNERCRDFSPEELQQLNTQAGHLSQQGHDKLHSASTTYFSAAQAAASRETRLRALRDVFTLADPMVFDHLGPSIGLYSRPGGGIDFYFAGERYPVNGDKGDILSAIQLLPCGLGLRCDANEYSLATRCIDYGECYVSRFDALRTGMMSGNPQRYEQTVALYERMLASIKAGRAEDFVP